MKKDKVFHPMLVILRMLSGCVSAKGVRYPNANFAPTNPSSVSVFSAFPPQPYEVIGEAIASGAPAATWGSVARGLKAKAAAIGGDAVVIIIQDTPFVGTWNTPGQVKRSTYGSTMSSGSRQVYEKFLKSNK
jgi:hypothetical protein